MTDPAPETLNDLRVEIDRIDAAMHALLMERGAIIDRLIAVKARSGGGSAFRPEREAAMMRRIAERHAGPLPLDTVESIWRVIISTFTYVQAVYAVHADQSGGDATMRDVARFHFGFTVPLVPHDGAAEVVAAVAGAPGDLGLVRIGGGAAAGPWWLAMVAADAPKVIARLPFVERPDHPAGMPVLVLARPSAASASREVVMLAVSVDRWQPGLVATVADLGGEILDDVADERGLALLVSLPGSVPPTRLQDRLGGLTNDLRIVEVGSHAARYDLAPRQAVIAAL